MSSEVTRYSYTERAFMAAAELIADSRASDGEDLLVKIDHDHDCVIHHQPDFCDCKPSIWLITASRVFEVDDMGQLKPATTMPTGGSQTVH